MTFWDELLANQVLMSAVTGWVVAQVLKTIIDLALNKSFNPERLVGSGGYAQLPLRNGMWNDDRRRLALRRRFF